MGRGGGTGMGWDGMGTIPAGARGGTAGAPAGWGRDAAISDATPAGCGRLRNGRVSGERRRVRAGGGFPEGDFRAEVGEMPGTSPGCEEDAGDVAGHVGEMS